MNRLCLFILFGICCTVYVATAAEPAQEPSSQKSSQVEFDKTIAPLLASRCLDCHNSVEHEGDLDLTQLKTALKGGESGPSFVPGNLSESLLWNRISEDEMPPENPLSKKEKTILKTWISSGAAWGTSPIDRFRFSTDSRAGADWWSLKPLKRPKPPTTKDRDWAQNPIDSFVLARLESKALTPSPQADRRTLIRRLSFDLRGLPPSPEEVRDFVEDESPEAYSQLVEQILHSPAYGERWARHWLDIVRFGESQGFERDKIRTQSWRYRDWVVDALNADMPYDEFARLQIAGDAMHPGNASAITATGFLVAGPYDEVGKSQISLAMRAVVRQDELEDIVSTYGQTFLGLTVNCARCHDHKFDPVHQSEYYRLTAAFGGVQHGLRNISNASTTAQTKSRATGMAARVRSLRRQIAAIEDPIRKQILATHKSSKSKRRLAPEPIARWDFDKNFNDQIGLLDGTAHGGAEVNSGAIVVDGKTGYVSTAPITKDVTEKTLEAWVRISNLEQQGGGVISLQTLNGVIFDAIVFGEREPGCWMAGSNGFSRTQSFAGPEETEATKRSVHVAIAYHADGTIMCYRNGRPYGRPYKSTKPVRFRAGKANLLFGLRHAPAGGNRFLSGAIERAQLYDRALSASEVAAAAGVSNEYVAEEDILPQLTKQQRKTREALQFEIGRLNIQQSILFQTKAYAVVPREPESTHFLIRGNPAKKGTQVTAGAVAAVFGKQADFGLPTDAPEAQRRIRLAEWTTDKKNPLFARVIVNRLWHYHFGTGLVSTPSDFGFNGSRPSHPHLIDWLADELLRNDFSLKAIHRKIVMSATYRQSSRLNPQAAAIDANNRWLWRKSPLRLEAEALRDTLLQLSGRLNHSMGGPGYQDFITVTRNTQFYLPIDPIGQAFERRSLYRMWIRSGRNRFLDVFDCPDPSTKSPQRMVTTTPLQALSLLNNSLLLRMANHLAERLQQNSNSVEQQIDRAYNLVYNRLPDKDERKLTQQFVEQQGLAALCRVLFNSSEFLYLD